MNFYHTFILDRTSVYSIKIKQRHLCQHQQTTRLVLSGNQPNNNNNSKHHRCFLVRKQILVLVRLVQPLLHQLSALPLLVKQIRLADYLIQILIKHPPRCLDKRTLQIIYVASDKHYFLRLNKSFLNNFSIRVIRRGWIHIWQHSKQTKHNVWHKFIVWK